MGNKKVVSLLPSASEIIVLLGIEEYLIGRSHECDFPESIIHLPVCTKSLIDSDASSSQIDVEVKERLSKALSVYEVDIPLLKSLQPDIILTQDQCKACAVHPDDLKKYLLEEINHPLEIVSLHPNSLETIFEDMQNIGDLLNRSAEANKQIEELRERAELICHKVKFVKTKARVACIEWLDPIMTAGNWTPELIDMAGGIPVLAEKQEHSKYKTMQELLEEDPDILLIAPCGFTIERTLSEMHLLTQHPEWKKLRAVQKEEVYIADGNAYFNRPGPRIIDSIEILAEIIQANQFYYGLENHAWIKWNPKTE